MNQMLSGVDRSQIIKATAIYLLVYAVLNSCGGVLALFGALTAGAIGAGGLAASGAAGTPEGAAAAAGLAGMGVLLLILGILALISVPVFAAAAFGLFQRKAWARNATVIALGLSVLMSLIGMGNGGIGTNIIWLVISAFVLYLFLTDEGIKMELTQ
jgi:hypothetical protein